MPLPQPRAGDVLKVRGRELPFSFFPVTRGNRRYGLYDAVFATSPWTVMRGTVNAEVPSAQRAEALAFLEQGEDFYRAATSSVSANPLLFYYAFLNLAKALVRVRGYAGSLDRAMHGLTERTEQDGTELKDSTVIAKDGSATTNVYPELVERLGYPRPSNHASVAVPDLLAQVVVGHRIWREALAGHRERFVDLKRIEFVQDKHGAELWLRLYVSRGDLSRYSITMKRLLDEGRLRGVLRQVDERPLSEASGLICLEQATTRSYSRPTDVVADLVADVRPLLWRIVTAVPRQSYRKYYIHMTPVGEARLPQISSLWCLFFYFGSVVRYRPHLFDGLLAGPYGAFIAEFVGAQAEQMLYMLASELCQREIARPAIV
jgi:hypothetical protein